MSVGSVDTYIPGQGIAKDEDRLSIRLIASEEQPRRTWPVEIVPGITLIQLGGGLIALQKAGVFREKAAGGFVDLENWSHVSSLLPEKILIYYSIPSSWRQVQ